MASTTALRIGTHDGSFHCDEALACYLLRQTTAYAGAQIVRTRDPAVLSSLPIIVDVGGQYIPEQGRFDHHQREFKETFGEGYKIRLSSAGLIYKHFGRELIAKLTGVGPAEVEVLYLKMYKDFVEALDGNDNGVSQYPTDIAPAYKSHTDLPSRVSRLNTPWNESATAEQIQVRFERAMEMAGSEFVEQLQYLAKSWLPARSVVEEALKNRTRFHPSGQILVLSEFTAWKSHLLELEVEMKVAQPILYVLYSDQSKSWRVQAVAVSEQSFESRLPLPEEWRGLRDDVLSAKLGLPDCVFVHASGFIGGHKNYEGALRMAVMSLELAAQNTSSSEEGPALKKPKLAGDA